MCKEAVGCLSITFAINESTIQTESNLAGFRNTWRNRWNAVKCRSVFIEGLEVEMWSLEIWHSFRWTISTKTGVHTRTCWLSAQFLQFSIEIQLGFSWIQSADWISEDAESLSFGFLSSLVAQLERFASSFNEFAQRILSTNSLNKFSQQILLARSTNLPSPRQFRVFHRKQSFLSFVVGRETEIMAELISTLCA